MDNKQSLEDKATTNAAAEEILSEEQLDSVTGGLTILINNLVYDTTTTDANNIHVRFGYGGGTGRG